MPLKKTFALSRKKGEQAMHAVPKPTAKNRQGVAHATCLPVTNMHSTGPIISEETRARLVKRKASAALRERNELRRGDAGGEGGSGKPQAAAVARGQRRSARGGRRAGQHSAAREARHHLGITFRSARRGTSAHQRGGDERALAERDE